VRRGVVAVDAAAEHGDRVAVPGERAAVRLAVDAARQTADDDETRCGKLAAELPRHLRAVRRARACADDGDGRPLEQLRIAGAAHEEPFGRIVDRAQQRWQPAPRDDVHAGSGGAR
jgi:hypothetical protein